MHNDSLNVLHFTDTHIYADPNHLFAGLNTRSSFLAARDAALAVAREWDLILVTGDLAAEAEAPAYTWLFEQLASFDAPIYCLPGNHDVGDVMEPLARAAGWDYCGDFTLGGWRFVLLDSSVKEAAHGCLSEAEIERLEEVLVRNGNLPTLVGLHHHPVAMNSAWIDTMMLDHAGRFWAVIDRYPQVRGVLWGHVHQNYDAFRNGVRLLATPSTCVQFAARSVNFAIEPLAPGFRRLRLSRAGEIATDVVRVR